MSSVVRRIAIATFGRSDFAILSTLARKLAHLDDFEVGWWIGGAHFDSVGGRTADEVFLSEASIWGTVNCGDYARSALSTVDQMAGQMAAFAHLAVGLPTQPVNLFPDWTRPDLVVILGDRFEAVSAGLAMVPLRVPVAHISGGSLTEGAIDDVFRHCLTKIAALHFCDLPEFARRIHQMGEPTDRIYTTGALGLDAFVGASLRSFDDLTNHFGLPGLRPGYVLATLHPESQQPEVNPMMARGMIEALDHFEHQVVFTYPNADPESEVIVDAIDRAVGLPGRFLVKSFGAAWYPAAMAHAGCMVGNSSGGIIEAASFSLPVVDIGDRQRGRTHGPNVVHSGRTADEIYRALVRVTDQSFEPFASAPNIYGDGHGSDRVIEVLRSLDLEQLKDPKRFAELDHSFDGQWRDLR